MILARYTSTISNIGCTYSFVSKSIKLFLVTNLSYEIRYNILLNLF